MDTWNGVIRRVEVAAPTRCRECGTTTGGYERCWRCLPICPDCGDTRYDDDSYDTCYDCSAAAW